MIRMTSFPLSRAALSLAALLVSSVALADTVNEIRIAVPDISAGPTPSGAGIVDVLRDRQTLEKAANAALAAKQIDATWSGAGVIALKARGLAELPLTTVDLDGAGSMQGVLLGRGAFVDAHPELVARLIKAQQPAITWLRNDEHKQDYINLVSKLASYPADILTTDAKDQSLVRIFAPQLDAPFLDNLQRSVDLALDAKLIRKGFEVKTWAEPRFIDAALQQTDTAAQTPQASL